MGQGRLFRIDFTEAGKKSAHNGRKIVSSIRSKTNPIEHFWLCESCAATLTVELSDSGEVCLVPLEGAARTPASVPAAETRTKRGASA